MFKILKKEELSEVITLFEIDANHIAKRAKPGNFFILKIHEEGERIPLTIADFDRNKGTITSVFQKVGKTTYHLGTLNEGDYLSDVIGPLGNPSHIENYGKVVCVGGGVGIAPVYPITKALKEAGNKIISIIGARSKDLLFWEDKMRNVSDELIVTTDDGSYGRKGVVTIPLEEILKEDQGRATKKHVPSFEDREVVQEPSVNLIVAIGPPIMMKFVCKTTEKYNVKTIVSLNSIMVDGTGMCGACRVEVGGETKFACVDGPEFDGHKVDFDLLMKRLQMYLVEEKVAMDMYSGKV
ncbi:MAG: sulfide/dihydroorotate dehydrogenase-like FAD/NAD-binding protein [Nitrospirae bacterium]|nr:sulfide/dihydroorotate dehydrogenase-like FAD/NAD-binding protein [Nitrospirota bacterium]